MGDSSFSTSGNSARVPSISVCIPTHGRTELLVESLESIRQQTLPPNEILVSDDLGSPNVKKLVEEFGDTCPFPVRYSICNGRGLAENINHCFAEATSDLILLLHDDDLLLPDSLALLQAPFVEYPGLVASYGKQLVITNDGQELLEDSHKLNARYRRQDADAGLQQSSLLSAALRQFPNDGYLVSAATARKVRQDPSYGAASEVDFGIRCGAEGEFFFVSEFTAKYRLSLESIGRGAGKKRDDCGYFSTQILTNFHSKYPEYAELIDGELLRDTPVGIAQAIALGHLGQAARWLVGPYHRQTLFTPGGIYRALRLVIAGIKRALGLNPRAE